MSAQQRANVQALVDRLVGDKHLQDRRWDDPAAIAGTALVDGWPENDCSHLAAYVMADRETIRADKLCHGWPDYDFGPSIKGHTWDLWPKPIPFFVGHLAREVHHPDIGRDDDEPPDLSEAERHTEEFYRRADYEYERSMDR